MSDAIEFPKSLVGSSLTVPASERGKKPYARAMIVLTIMHHIATAIQAYQHWVLPSHRTIAMDIGVWVNLGLTGLGFAALYFGLDDEGEKKVARKHK